MALWTKIDSQLGQPKYLRVGQLTGIGISGVMTGYTSGSFIISAPTAVNVAQRVQATATYTADGTKITAVTITNPGAGYVTAPTITTSAGTGAVIKGAIKASGVQGGVPNTEIALVSVEEAALASNRKKGIKGPGWYRITEKVGQDGVLRYMTETLVKFGKTAVNSVTTDAKGDNLVVGNIDISITTQPTARSIATGSPTTFVVVASGASLTYQWQVQSGGTGAYTNLTNAGVYTTVTTATLNISNVAGLTNSRYRCVVGNSGSTAQATSNGAKLTVV